MNKNNDKHIHPFTEKLLNWAQKNPRPLPWKQTKDPYIIWLSEIILQQTRVAQGLPYFEKFARQYPTVNDLAQAPEDELMNMWEGLGYYSRARNLHYTAKYIASELGGQFPDTYDNILQLKGVGAYTAAAIASFAYNLPHAVVDGNVYRVLSRFFGINTPIDSTNGKKEFAALAQELLATNQADVYNQAIMDFGSMQCTPKKTNCSTCPMMEDCAAYRQNKVNQLPVKQKKLVRKERFFHYWIIRSTTAKQQYVLIEKRLQSDIWQNLYQFPLTESNRLLAFDELLLQNEVLERFGSYNIKKEQVSDTYIQLLTHQKIHTLFIEISMDADNFNTFANQHKHFLVIPTNKIENYAYPKVINRYLEKDWNSEIRQMKLF